MEWTSLQVFVAGFIIIVIAVAIFAAVVLTHSEIGESAKSGISETLNGLREALLSMDAKIKTPVGDVQVSG